MKTETLLAPLASHLDPAWCIDLEPGNEYEWVVQYDDLHTETGKLRYSGEHTWIPLKGVNSNEMCKIPIMIPLTPFTEGNVRILRWGK